MRENREVQSFSLLDLSHRVSYPILVYYLLFIIVNVTVTVSYCYYYYYYYCYYYYLLYEYTKICKSGVRSAPACKCAPALPLCSLIFGRLSSVFDFFDFFMSLFLF